MAENETTKPQSTGLGDLFQQLGESMERDVFDLVQAGKAVSISEAVHEGMPHILSMLTLAGGIDKIDWESFIERALEPLDDEVLPFDSKEVDSYRLFEAAMMLSILLLRVGFVEDGTEVSAAPLYLRTALFTHTGGTN